ncbi:MAG: CbiM family transporter, partial [Gemmataceae bacterium]|nr:CbiM family transporter [Gemmataceae bacterium]
LLLVAVWRTREDDVPRVGVMSAAFFVASSAHIKVLATSVHLVLNGLVGVVLGRRAPLAVTVGLALQFFLIQHGGYSTIGINACIASLPALAAGALYPLLRRLRVPPFVRGFVLGSGAVAGAVGLNFLVLLLGGKTDWERFAQLVLLAHAPVILFEGAMLGVLVRYLEKVKPSLLRGEGPGASIQDSGEDERSW